MHFRRAIKTFKRNSGVFPFALALIERNKDTAGDPRFLSQISVPLQRNCNSDVSNDGHLIYTVCDSKAVKDGMTPSGQAKLYIHDISDLHKPEKISETDIGQVEGFRLIARNGIVFYQQLANRGINIVDARDPQHPKPAGHVDMGEWHLDFRVSDNGHLIVNKAPLEKYTYFDVSDPSLPKEVAESPDAANVIASPGKWKVYDSGKIEGIPGSHTIYDARDGKLLLRSSETSSMLEYYDLSVPDKPQLLASFPEDGSTFSVNIIPHTQAVVFGQGGDNGTYVLKLSKAVNSVFDPQHLKDEYAFVATHYPGCADEKAFNAECMNLKFHGLARLKDAGIDKLLNEQPEGFTSEQRTLMLNDYGFWLYKWNKSPQGLRESAEVLRKVTQLTPDRAPAWLNLADTLQTLIPLASPETAKAALWTEAKQDYNRYNELTGKDAPASFRLASFDLPKIIASSADVCDYIAQASNQGQLDTISSPIWWRCWTGIAAMW